MKETIEQMKETDLEWKEANKRWEKLEKQYWEFWNFVRNDWAVVEEYFYTALDKTNKLHWEKYDYFSQWEKHSLAKWVEQEFDIIWYNWNKITAIEVKKIVHKNDVKKLIEKQLPFLEKYMWWVSKYKNHRIYGWIAGFKINKDAKEYAKKHWIIILTKNSKNQIEELTKNDEIKAFWEK
jgi:hypothetical protein